MKYYFPNLINFILISYGKTLEFTLASWARGVPRAISASNEKMVKTTFLLVGSVPKPFQKFAVAHFC